MKPNVLLVVLDSVRAQNTGLQGYDRETTPYLEEFAEKATVYKQARTSGKWSVPAHASMFTGLAPSVHGLYDPTATLQPDQTVFSELQEEGYRTGLFTSNSFLTGDIDTGLSYDFGTVVGSLDPFFPQGLDPLNYSGGVGSFLRDALADEHPIQSVANGLLTKLGWDYPYILPTFLTTGTSASRPRDDYYIHRFIEWMQNDDGPWAACINLMDAHVPYLPEDNPWGTFKSKQRQREFGLDWRVLSKDRFDLLPEFEDLYDGAIRQTDSHVQRIIQTLKRREILDNTLIVIAGDHGDGFGEQSPIRGIPTIQHLYGFHESILHIPLITKYPGQQRGEVVEDLAAIQCFPNLVRKCVFENTRTDMRRSEVYVSGHLTSNNEDSWRRHTDSDPRFRGQVCVKYEQKEGGEILKRIGWKSRAIEMTSDAVRAASVADVNRDFESLPNLDIVDAGETMETEQAVKRRLEDLGYV